MVHNTNWQERAKKEYAMAEIIYRQKIKELEPAHLGKIVGIHVATGRHFLGDDELQVYDAAASELGSDCQLVFMRVGENFVHTIG